MDIQHLRADYLLNEFFHSKAITHGNSVNSGFLLALLLIGIILACLIYIIRKAISFKKSFTEQSILLELTPPATTEKTSYTTQQLFSVIHNLGRQRSFIDKLIGKKIAFACEIVSTQNQGIRYLIRTTPNQVNNLKRSLLSYMPQVSVQTTNEYLPNKIEKYETKVIEFNLTKNFAYPLKKQDTLDEHDPVAYITGMMTKLSLGELISFQMALAPTNPTSSAIIKHKIMRSEDAIEYIDGLSSSKLVFLVKLPVVIVKSILGIFGWAFRTVTNDLSDAKMAARQSQLHYMSYYSTQGQVKPARILSPFEQDAVKAIEEKIDQPLFETRIRLLIVVKDTDDLSERVKGFTSSLGVFSAASNQSLKKKLHIPNRKYHQFLYLNFKKRLLSFVFNSSPDILSVSEISDLYHFPFTRVTQTENIAKSYSKELPAPLSLKNNPNFDVEFAKNNYGGTTTMIGLTQEERARHMYVIGATGTGKTTMLLSMINQDLKNGNGVCVVDPHGDLAEAAINCIPDDRIKDLIYFNPFDIKYPIGVNLLELTPGLDGDDSLLEKEFITESVISLFRKLFSDAWAAHPHRIEYILRNTIHTAFTLENPTLFTIFDLLNDPVFQKKVVSQVQDENLKNFWKFEFGKAGDYQKVKMVAPVTARIGRFLFSPSAKRILEQEKSTINFDEILDGKKILICNLAKGNLGEDTSEMMGITILNKIQLAALKRARVERAKRNEFYLFVDEFQNFATPSFIQMLSEARKYGLSLTMAEQTTSQQKDRNLVDIILANAGTVVTFRSANPKDEQLLLPQFYPYINAGEISNLPSYHFYMKKAAIIPDEPFSGETMPVTIIKDRNKWKRFIEASRNDNAIVYVTKQKSIKIANNGQEQRAEDRQDSQPKTGLPA
jgi:hypothetical protein